MVTSTTALPLQVSPFTSFAESPPACDPAEQAWLQLMGRRGQAGGSGVSGQNHGGRPVQLKQRQVIVMGFVIVVLMKNDPLNSRHLLCGAAAAEEEFAKVDCPQRWGIKTAGDRVFS